MKRKIFIFLITACAAIVVRGEDIVWSTEKTISEPLAFAGDNLKIINGAKIIFKDAGTLTLDSGSLMAEHAEFTADSVLEKSFRITLLRSKVEIRNCSFQNLETNTPMEHARGFMAMRFGSTNILRDNKFEKCSPVAFLNSNRNIIEKNSFGNCEGALYFFHSAENRIANNSFLKNTNALALSNSSLNMIVSNRFEECHNSVHLCWNSNHNKSYGNDFFSCATAFLMRGENAGNLFSGSLIEKAQNALIITNGGGKDNMFTQSVIADTDCAFKALSLKNDIELIVRNTVLFQCDTGLWADSGIFTMQNCLLWQIKHEFIKMKDAIRKQENILKTEPKFKNADESDYRPAIDSPLLKSGMPPMTNIGLFQ